MVKVLVFILNVYPPKPPSGRGWDNDTCIFGPIYGFIQNNNILYEKNGRIYIKQREPNKRDYIQENNTIL